MKISQGDKFYWVEDKMVGVVVDTLHRKLGDYTEYKILWDAGYARLWRETDIAEELEEGRMKRIRPKAETKS